MFVFFQFPFQPNSPEQLTQLRDQYHRLRTVVGELLALANDRDERHRYAGGDGAAWNEQMRQTCLALVKLGDELPKIEKLLEQKKVAESRDAILNACRKAIDIWQKFRQF